MVMAMCGRIVARLGLALAAVGLLLLLADPVSANDQFLMVDRTDDSEDSQCLDGVPYDCSLRGAINRANASSYIHIGFLTSEVLLSTPLPPLSGLGTMVSGGCGAEVALDALAQSDGAVLVVDADDVTIAYLMIINGPTSGGSADILIKSGRGIDIHGNYLGLTKKRVPCRQPCGR